MREFFEFKKGDHVRFSYGVAYADIGFYAGIGDKAIVEGIKEDGLLRLAFRHSSKIVDVDPKIVMHEKQFQILVDHVFKRARMVFP